MPEVYLEPSRTSTITLSCDFCKEAPPKDVRLGSKYASVYIYMQVSPIEIICILNVFAVKYSFSDKRRRRK